MEHDLAEAAPEVLAAFDSVGMPEIVGRQCALAPYTKLRGIESYRIRGQFTLFASPDSTYAVTKRWLETAKQSILIGIYDFTAGYIKELLLGALQRGVKVSLMLDLDQRAGETPIFDALRNHGAQCVPAPSCASKRAQYFASSHEKVVVIDDELVVVQSGNYSDNSIPRNEVDGAATGHFYPGNRDMGVAVRSKALAAFFTKVLRSDMRLELGGMPEALVEGLPTAEFEALAKAPTRRPPTLFKSKAYTPPDSVTVTPILSPDNYMDEVPALLGTAKKSICIEQQYIRGDQPAIEKLLAAIDEARRKRTLSVQVIVAAPFPSQRSWAREVQKITALQGAGLRLGYELRILNPRYFVHCHNKLVIVDDQIALVSSQNWSDSAVLKNREAGLLIESGAIARYYGGIFDVDWMSGLKKLAATPPRGKLLGPEALARGGMVPLNWGDYAEV